MKDLENYLAYVTCYHLFFNRNPSGDCVYPSCNWQLMARCLGDRLDASPSVDAGIVHSSSFYLLFMRRGIKETATAHGFVKDSLKFFPSILEQLVRRRPCERVMALWDEHVTKCYSDSRHGHACCYIYIFRSPCTRGAQRKGIKHSSERYTQWLLLACQSSWSHFHILKKEIATCNSNVKNWLRFQSCLSPLSFSSHVRC